MGDGDCDCGGGGGLLDRLGLVLLELANRHCARGTAFVKPREIVVIVASLIDQ